jgi:hypothetical protein
LSAEAIAGKYPADGRLKTVLGKYARRFMAQPRCLQWMIWLQFFAVVPVIEGNRRNKNGITPIIGNTSDEMAQEGIDITDTVPSGVSDKR